MLANPIIRQIAHMLLARRVFYFTVFLICLQFAFKKVVAMEVEEMMVKKIVVTSSKCKTAVHNLGQH